MSKEKQIEEMAKFVCNACEMGGGFEGYCCLDNDYKNCYSSKTTAFAIYNAGYRKQIEAEWVETDYKTVEHGFVERRGKALKCTNCLHVSKKFDRHMKFCPECGAKMKGGEGDFCEDY